MSKVAVVGVVGRTNAGKSTLVNALVGEKVSIVSPVKAKKRKGVQKEAATTGAQSPCAHWSPVKGVTPQLEKIESIVMSIAMFAKAQNVTVAHAYRLLTRKGAIKHLDEHYEIESCLPIEHIVHDLEGMCGICKESMR